MKKRITWLWTVLLVSLSLQAAQVLYVYRSDSVIDAFFTSESIVSVIRNTTWIVYGMTVARYRKYGPRTVSTVCRWL